MYKISQAEGDAPRGMRRLYPKTLDKIIHHLVPEIYQQNMKELITSVISEHFSMDGPDSNAEEEIRLWITQFFVKSRDSFMNYEFTSGEPMVEKMPGQGGADVIMPTTHALLSLDKLARGVIVYEMAMNRYLNPNGIDQEVRSMIIDKASKLTGIGINAWLLIIQSKCRTPFSSLFLRRLQLRTAVKQLWRQWPDSVVPLEPSPMDIVQYRVL